MVDDFVTSLAPTRVGDMSTRGAGWRLRFTEGLLVLVPMPDFSMPFNVVALSATALTFFFGSIFRLTAAGRLPHWVLKKENVEPGRRWIKSLWRALLIGALAGFYYLAQCAPKDIQEFAVYLE